MNALNELHDELVSLFGFQCEIGFSLSESKKLLENNVNNSSTTNLNSTMFFGRCDPNVPNAAHQYQKSMGDLIKNSSKDGNNEILNRRMLIAFSYALWEDKFRGKIAEECEFLEKNFFESEVFFDLNKYRQAVLHASGKLNKETNALQFFKKGDEVNFTELQIYELFKTLIFELNILSKKYYNCEGNFDLDKTFSNSS